MILEVNNTFDERRMYFLQQEKTPKREDGYKKFKQTWAKDFHVSPFSSRKGAYALAAENPFPDIISENCIARVHATITLRSSKGFIKLVARVNSEGAAVDPTSLDTWQKIGFLFRWWWIGLATIPRTIKEAAVLYFSKKLHVWYKPEPLKTTIPCNGSPLERRAEVFFRNYLEYLVKNAAGTPIQIIYTPAGLQQNDPIMIKPPSGFKEPERLHLTVLTPVFYKRFLQYASDFEAFNQEYLNNSTVWLSDLGLISDLTSWQSRELLQLKSHSFRDIVYLWLVKKGRAQPPKLTEQPLMASSTSQRPQYRPTDPNIRLSFKDAYILRTIQEEISPDYHTLVLETLYQGTYGLGRLWVIGCQLSLFETMIIIYAVNELCRWVY